MYVQLAKVFSNVMKENLKNCETLNQKKQKQYISYLTLCCDIH